MVVEFQASDQKSRRACQNYYQETVWNAIVILETRCGQPCPQEMQQLRPTDTHTHTHTHTHIVRHIMF